MQISIFNKTQEFRSARTKFNGNVGFVPTMGNLHAGHISLLEQSLIDNDLTVLSIFVNPKQFGQGEDLDKYPRTFEEDLNKTKELLAKYPNKRIYVFAPANEEIYPENFSTVINVPKLACKLEGEFRPTHFEGVCTVVYLLFQIVKPHKAYFGQKDYQQLAIISQMVKDLLLDIEIVPMPITREADGLAMSSRNQYLNEKQRVDALILSKTINKLADTIIDQGVNVAMKMAKHIQSEDKNFNYLEIKNAFTLDDINDSIKDFVILATYQQGQTRLLDNKVVKL